MRYVFSILGAALLAAGSAAAGGGINIPQTKVRAATGKVATVQGTRVEVQADSGERLEANFGNQTSDVIVGQTAWIDGRYVKIVDFPIDMTKDKKVGDADYMKTTVKLSNTGVLRATTKTWTTACADGFTGGVRVVLMKKDGNDLYITKLHKYGVNGTCVPSAPSSRTESWDENIPVELVKQTAKLAIVHLKKPTDRTDEFLEKAKEVAEILKTLSEAYGNVNGGGGQKPTGGGMPSGQ